MDSSTLRMNGDVFGPPDLATLENEGTGIHSWSLSMKRLLGILLALLLGPGIVCASEIPEFMKGSFGMYDVSAEMVILKKIESQTDPEKEKVIIDGMALKFEYFYNEFRIIDGYQVAAVHFSDKEDDYVFDYYVAGDEVAKIVLYLKNEEVINKQVYPEKKDSSSDK
jgi:hypothetical protein